MTYHAPITWQNADGTKSVIDLNTLPLIDKPGNAILPNLYVESDDHPTDPGRLYIIPGPNLLHFGDDAVIYLSSRSYKEHGTDGVTMYSQCPGPYPCSKPHPHPQETP